MDVFCCFLCFLTKTVELHEIVSTLLAFSFGILLAVVVELLEIVSTLLAFSFGILLAVFSGLGRVIAIRCQQTFGSLATKDCPLFIFAIVFVAFCELWISLV